MFIHFGLIKCCAELDFLEQYIFTSLNGSLEYKYKFCTIYLKHITTKLKMLGNNIYYLCGMRWIELSK